MYNFNNLIDDLNHGREIEFKFNNSSYSITNFKGFWYFYCEETHISIRLSPFEDKLNLINAISSPKIIGIDIKDIFNHKRYDSDSLFIL
ncbi:hypothetical protein AN639_10750 [Candidatus Epulonipiscium fishelsonii]|uniref:Uncharacterized protein n=1 Tax=Candidatus Epulonipiscium fishelsonii TaxID=77094 RepID=A0ACC8XFB9_9FIRM|nr:hypothetical protein AN396_00505 [Epulopiscium sp. SCG-B11WGA-EpuloA1]ONI43282.1 hypothetical protein AN639_10750 [Epulopiscium sp. SCG-B05WGA-EpuloA1]